MSNSVGAFLGLWAAAAWMAAAYFIGYRRSGNPKTFLWWSLVGSAFAVVGLILTRYPMWHLWGALLLLQNASFTMVSRARNSGSYAYHAVAALFSNGVWFFGMFFVVDVLSQVRETGDYTLVTAAFVFYTTLTVFSSVAMHWFLHRFVETGKRRVGA